MSHIMEQLYLWMSKCYSPDVMAKYECMCTQNTTSYIFTCILCPVVWSGAVNEIAISESS